MSPAERVARAIAEVRAELDRLARVEQELASVEPGLVADCPPPIRMAVAGYLHAFYTGCEAVIARLARLRGDMPTGDGWHQALLVRATAPVEGERPPLLRPETADPLFHLLRFRHFFRTQYGVDLDVEKLRRLVGLVTAAHAGFRRDILGLLDALESDA